MSAMENTKIKKPTEIANPVECLVMRDDEVKHGQYRCEMCREAFGYGWTEEEAKAEADKNGFDTDDCGVVCDDCYKKTPWGWLTYN